MKPKDIIYNKWIKCSDDNYWQSEHDIVLCPINGEVYMYTESNCPYGWNVLVKIGARFYTVEYPNEIKEYMRNGGSRKVDFFDCYDDDYIVDKVNKVSNYIDYLEEHEYLSYEVMHNEFRFADFINGEFDREIDEFTEDSLDELEKWCMRIADSCLDEGVFDR